LFAVSGIEDAVTYSARDGGDSEAFLEFDLCHEGLWVMGYGLWVTGYGLWVIKNSASQMKDAAKISQK
jgi:hypothetical protein